MITERNGKSYRNFAQARITESSSGAHPQLLVHPRTSNIVNIYSALWEHAETGERATVVAVDANSVGYAYQNKRFFVSRAEFFTYFVLEEPA